MKVYKANIAIELEGDENDVNKFIDEMETFITFKPQFNVFKDFIGLEAMYQGVVSSK